MRKLLDFLQVKINDDDIKCALKRKEGIYRRHKKKIVGFDIENKTIKELIAHRKERVLNILQEM